jgi:hypothetical protein
MAASGQNPSKDQDKASKKPSDTVNLTDEEMRRVSGGAKVGPIPPSPTPPSPNPPPPTTPTV